MKKEDSKIIATVIRMEDGEIWTCHMKCLPSFIVQVEKLEDAPKELAKLFEVLIDFNIKTGNIEKEDWTHVSDIQKIN